MSYFIGQSEVNSYEEQDNGFMKVFLKGKVQPIFLKKKTYEKMVSLEPIDLTQLQQRKLLPIVSDVMKVLMDWDIKVSEIDALFSLVSNWVNDRLDYAAGNLWIETLKNKPEEKWVPNEIYRERTIGDIDNFLTKNNGKEDSEISGKGDGTQDERTGSLIGSKK